MLWKEAKFSSGEFSNFETIETKSVGVYYFSLYNTEKLISRLLRKYFSRFFSSIRVGVEIENAKREIFSEDEERYYIEGSFVIYDPTDEDVVRGAFRTSIIANTATNRAVFFDDLLIHYDFTT